MSVNNVQSNFSNGMSYSANLVSTTIPTQSLVPIQAITAATTLTPTQCMIFTFIFLFILYNK